MLNGIDISGWQEGLDLAKVPCDFVIIKGTGGNGYVSSACDGFFQQAKRLGKLIGVYHFAREEGCAGSAIDEARWFVSNCKNYFNGTVIPILDFEKDTHLGGEWARTWLDEVYRLTGVKPLFYTYLAVLEQVDFTQVVNGGYGLWLAAYGQNEVTYGYRPNTPTPSANEFPFVAMYQYCSKGRLQGWAYNLDLNVFYGDRDTWLAYASKYGVKVKNKPKRPATEVVRYTGDNRYLTSMIIDGTHAKPNKVIISGESFSDGLSATYFARANKANLVFDSDNTAYGLDTYIIGSDVKNRGGARVISGHTRYDTNLDVLKRCIKDSKTIIVTNGENWADGVSASTVRLPIMLVSDYVNSNQIVELKKHDELEFVIIGGSDVVSTVVERQLRELGKVSRIAGKNRYETSKLIADRFYPNADTVILVNAWADGLSAGNIGSYPILLVDEKNTSDAKIYCQSHKLKKAFVIGDISDKVVAEIL